MIKALLDINVLLDVLQARRPHYESSAQVLSLCAEGLVKGYVSAGSFGVLDYLLVKGLGREQGRLALKKVRSMTHVAMIDERAVDLALESSFSDFEDAIQYYSAVGNGLSHIVTRNKKDFARAKLVVATPEEFLEMRR